MEVEELHPTQPPCKFSRIGNGRNDTSKIGTTIKGSVGAGDHHHRQFQADTQDGGEVKMAVCNPAIGGAAAVTVAGDGATNRLRGWHHSRIIRVSRASGGKDRHSKVWTSKGLRDRRVRLSVTTAIQFYDLQDRLGYDQPSKAVEWLIKAAADAIAELPSLNACFPDIPKQLLVDDKRITTAATAAEQGFDSADLQLHEEEEDPGGNYNQNQLSLSKSACSSNSETSKGSGLSLARSDVRVTRVKAARERAKEKAAAKEKEKEKEKEKDNTTTPTDSRISHHHQQHQNITIAQNSSFTELLTGGIGGSIATNNHNSKNTAVAAATTMTSSPSEVNLFHTRPWPLTAMDYFGPGLLGPPTSSTRGSQQQHCSSAAGGFPGQIQSGNSIQQQQQGMTMSMSIPQFNVVSTGETHHGHHHQHHQQEQQLLQQQQQQQHQHQHHFPFVSDHLMPAVTTTQGGGPVADYNLNFTIASGLAGFNRGTLQSNSSPSPSLLPPQFQRFASHIDGSTTHLPFFIGGGAPQQPLENHQHNHNHNHNHHHQQFFPPGLQLCYSDGNSSRQSDHKGKGKNN